MFFAGFVAAILIMDWFRPPPDPDPYTGDAHYYDGVLHGDVKPNNLN